MFSGVELIVGLALVAIMMLWGPSKIPEFARGIGRARGELNAAQKEFQMGLDNAQQDSERNRSSRTASDDALIETANKLGIDTLGKTTRQISDEIAKKFEEKSV